MSLRPPVLVLSLLVAACGRSALPIDDFRSAACGNGIVDEDEGEACDLGDDNEDRPAIVLIHRGDRRAVMPLDRPQDAIAFYGYLSESSHTGFEEADLSVLMLQRDTSSEALSLITHHGIDEDTTGVTLDHGLVSMDLSGLPDETGLLLADEPTDEVFLDGGGEARGRWEFWRNSDGAVFGSLPFPGEWRIVVEVDLLDGIERWRFIAEDETSVALSTDFEAVLQALPTPSRCRTDCTIPRCGDGIVDGGEICDDGNELDGDGCSDGCSSLR